mgnify:CR=1 FL=1
MFLCHLENKICLPQDNMLPLKVPSTNTQYHFETSSSLKGIIELEFGFRKSFPVVVADLCKDLVKNNGISTQTMLWIGAGTGRGPLLMSNVFDEVCIGCSRILYKVVRTTDIWTEIKHTYISYNLFYNSIHNGDSFVIVIWLLWIKWDSIRNSSKSFFIFKVSS